jgi:PAS domain S-box-containing protein
MGPRDVLHVDDEPDFAELTAEYLRREDDRFSVETAMSANEGLDRLNNGEFDCIVSDYDMPGQNGIEFLETVQREYPGLPFIVFTGKGSEQVASEAISKGATDYLQKKSETDQYRLLANRINNAVSQYRSEARLRETKEEYATVFESALTGLLLVNINSDGFRYQRCNPRAEELIGRDRTEIVGHTPCEVLGPEDGRKVRGAYRKCVETGQPVEYTATLTLSAGQVLRPGKVTPVVTDSGMEQLVVSFYDITDERRRQEQLDRKNDLFKRAQESANVGAWEYDIQQDQTIWTDQVYDIYNHRRDQPPDNEELIELHHPDDRPLLREAFQNAVENGEPYDLELRLQLTDGETRWVRTRGQPQTEDGEQVRIRGAIQDITESKRRIKETKQLKRQYQALAESIPNGAVFLFDDALQYVRARGTELEAVGLSPDQIEGTGPHDVFPEELADELAEYFTEALNGNSNTFTQGLGEQTYRNRVAPVQDGGDVTYGIALAQNVTEQAERKQKLKAQNERLERFASVVSHDLRNPLQVADSRLELLRDDCESEHIDNIAEALERMDALIEDLLTLSRQGEPVGETEVAALAEVVEACWQTVETGEAVVNIDVDRRVKTDPNRLAQLLENLFRNAVEHNSGEVTITVGKLEDGFYVEDDGTGIPEDERNNVFNTGYSTTRDGTGFGLSIVEEVVDAHGWDIRATDGVNGGARFEVTGVESTG